MKFSILCIGTYGDVAPYVALAAKLKQEGHDVTIAAHEKARSLCERFFLKFHPVGGDLSILTSPEESKELFEARGFKKLNSFFKLMVLFRRVLDIQLKDCLEASRGADVLIYHPAAFAGPHLAEHFKITAIKMNLQPELPTSQHPSCLIPIPKWLGRVGNVIGHFISQQFLWQVFRGKINRWRCEVLKLPKSPFWKPSHYSKIRELVAFSPSLMKRPTDWHPSVAMVGFCRLQEADRWTPPENLQRFLAEGELPLYLGFGSLTETFPTAIVATMIDVLKTKKIRAIVPRNLEGLKEIDLPPHILAIDYVPHDWLFSKVSAVIHHGGVGTLSSGLHAGKPTWVIPCIVDQFFFGEKVCDWGVGPQPLAKVHFNRKDFEKGLDQLLQKASYREKALKLQRVLNQENGVDNAYKWILKQV
jgi:sterol 3beta-glucosyltransferase